MALQLLAHEDATPVLIGTAEDMARFEGIAFTADGAKASLTLAGGDEGDFSFLELSDSVTAVLTEAAFMIVIAVDADGKPIAAGRYHIAGEREGSFDDLDVEDLVAETAKLMGRQVAYDLFSREDETPPPQ